MKADAVPAVLITGASTGIGRCCAIEMERRGWRVFAGVRREADGQALREAAGERLEPVILDVTDGEHVDAAVARIDEAVGEAGLKGLVNNAGIAVSGLQEYLELEDWRKQFEVNVFGVVRVTRAFLPLLRRAERARIVNMSSISGKVAMPVVGPYAASKHALEGLTDALRLELHGAGIHACTVEPGNIKTPIWDKAGADADERLAALPAEAHERYPFLEQFAEEIVRQGREKGSAPERVAVAVGKALTARRPRARYLVGGDARAAAWMRWMLPDRVWDFLVRKAAKL